MRRLRCLPAVLLTAGLGCTAPGYAPLDDDDTTDDPLEMFDAHLHFVPGADVPALVDEYRELGVVGLAVLGFTPFERLHDDFPGYAFGYTYIPGGGATELTDETVDAVVDALEDGARGVGELSVRHFAAGDDEAVDLPADHPFLMRIYAEAAAHAAPVSIHFDFETGRMGSLQRALDGSPGTDFVWAHAGDAEPDDVAPLLEAHANLHVDVACRNPYYPRWTSTGRTQEVQRMDDGDGALKDDWRDLLERFPDRVVFGTDIGPGTRHEQLGDVIPYHRELFEQLEPDVAEAVGAGTIRRLLGLDQ